MSKVKKWVKIPITNFDNIEFLDSDEEFDYSRVRYYEPKNSAVLA